MNENITTALYWEYDSRIVRRWNMDPVFKENESPYAAFGNNPIWNIDPNGADTIKRSELNIEDVKAAQKAAVERVAKLLSDKKLSIKTTNDDYKVLGNFAIEYAKKNNLSFGATVEFMGILNNYFRGLEDMAWWRGSDFTSLNKDVINNNKLDDFVKLQKIDDKISSAGREMVGTVKMGGFSALYVATAGLFPNVGASPKGLVAVPIVSKSADMGRLIGWGEGQTVMAAQTTKSITQNLTRAQVQAFANQGLTKQWVQSQLKLYGKAVLDGTKTSKNVNLVPRKELMEKILYLWPK